MAQGEGTAEDPYIPQMLLGSNDLGQDAWGRQKVVTDFTLFHGMWTFGVPNRVWKMSLDTGAGHIEQAEVDNDQVKSEDGMLVVTGKAGSDARVCSKRSPRYQPNRGHLYSTAVICPSPNLVGTRRWGMCGDQNGLFFEMVGDGVAHVLNIVRRTTISGVTNEDRVNLTSLLPSGFDLSKGNVFDIQMEWRGIGNFYIFFNLKKIYTFNLLGTLTTLSVANPALNVGVECLDAGATDIQVLQGCVDVSSEGGLKERKLYNSATTGKALVSVASTGTAILAVKIPTTIVYNGNTVNYTRDILLTELTSFCKDEAFTSMYIGRSVALPSLDALAEWTEATDTFFLVATNSSGNLDTAFDLDVGNMTNIYSVRQEKDISVTHKNPDPDHAEFYLTPGDIIVVEIAPDVANSAGVTLEFAEEV